MDASFGNRLYVSNTRPREKPVWGVVSGVSQGALSSSPMEHNQSLASAYLLPYFATLFRLSTIYSICCSSSCCCCFCCRCCRCRCRCCRCRCCSCCCRSCCRSESWLSMSQVEYFSSSHPNRYFSFLVAEFLFSLKRRDNL